jgi:hypothetical protein
VTVTVRGEEKETAGVIGSGTRGRGVRTGGGAEVHTYTRIHIYARALTYTHTHTHTHAHIHTHIHTHTHTHTGREGGREGGAAASLTLEEEVAQRCVLEHHPDTILTQILTPC